VTPQQDLLSSFARSEFGRQRRIIGVRSRHGRCPSALLTLAGGERVFVKRDPGPGGAMARREAEMLDLLAADPRSAPLAPRLLSFEPTFGMLITAGLDMYVPLDRKLRNDLLAEPMIAVKAGSALAHLHGCARGAIGASVETIPFPIDSHAGLTPDELASGPADYARVAASLQASRDTIGRLRERWRHSHFIHGDCKANNLLLRVDSRSTGQPPLVLVDWEMAGLSDPLWDVGSYTGSVLLAWMEALAPGEGAEGLLKGPKSDSLRRQIGYFLITYSQLADAATGGMEEFLWTALQYAGIFLVHRVIVGLETTGFLNPASSLILDFGLRLLNDPERARLSLLAGVRL
jgi:Phosphotransferase enzyme family